MSIWVEGGSAEGDRPCRRQSSRAGRRPEFDGDFVVFLIGMRINKPWRPQKWLPTVMAMPRMLKELESAPPEVGFLGYASVGRMTGRSFDPLEAYARARDRQHWPAWVFRRRIPAATSASGTRPTSCAPASTKPSTAACRSPAWRKPAPEAPSRRRRTARGKGSASTLPEEPLSTGARSARTRLRKPWRAAARRCCAWKFSAPLVQGFRRG